MAVRLKKHVPTLLRSVVAEFVGTLALVLIGCGSCSGGDQGEAAIDDQANTVRQIFIFFFPCNFVLSTLYPQDR